MLFSSFTVGNLNPGFDSCRHFLAFEMVQVIEISWPDLRKTEKFAGMRM